jgi:predicted DNA-binding transcriptional regulator AlpA
MPRTKSAALNLSALPLNPHYFYRKHSPVTKAVIGLQATQIDAMVEAGELPPPVPAYEGSKAVGWLGSQLLELQQKRLARAKAAAERRASERETATAAPANDTPTPRPRRRTGKTRP